VTLDEFNDRQDKILAVLPEELRPVLSYMAYERSHAYGYEEVLNSLGGMVHDLRDAVLAYGSRMERLGRDWAGA
jgi:hypothetical protein